MFQKIIRLIKVTIKQVQKILFLNIQRKNKQPQVMKGVVNQMTKRAQLIDQNKLICQQFIEQKKAKQKTQQMFIQEGQRVAVKLQNKKFIMKGIKKIILKIKMPNRITIPIKIIGKGINQVILINTKITILILLQCQLIMEILSL